MEKVSYEYYVNIQNNRVKELREKCGIKVEDLARVSGTTRTTLWQLETGKIDRLDCDKFDAIAVALGVDPDDLLRK